MSEQKPLNLAHLDFFKDAYELDVNGVRDVWVRDLFRNLAHCPSVLQQRKDIDFRDLRFLQQFAGAVEMAYYDCDNWAVMWPSALMIICKYKLFPFGHAPTQPGAAVNTTQTPNTKGTI